MVDGCTTDGRRRTSFRACGRSLRRGVRSRPSACASVLPANGRETALVIADAVLWHGADTTLATSFAAEAEDRDLFGRALVFRLVAEQLADDPRHGAFLAPYRAVLAALG